MKTKKDLKFKLSVRNMNKTMKLLNKKEKMTCKPIFKKLDWTK